MELSSGSQTWLGSPRGPNGGFVRRENHRTEWGICQPCEWLPEGQISRMTRWILRFSNMLYGYGSIPMKIPFLVGWTSINPSYFGFTRGTRFDPLPYDDMMRWCYCMLAHHPCGSHHSSNAPTDGLTGGQGRSPSTTKEGASVCRRYEGPKGGQWRKAQCFLI